MKRKTFWKLLPIVCLAPMALAKIKVKPKFERYSKGILNYINDNHPEANTLDWSHGMTE